MRSCSGLIFMAVTPCKASDERDAVQAPPAVSRGKSRVGTEAGLVRLARLVLRALNGVAFLFLACELALRRFAIVGRPALTPGSRL